MHFRKKVFSEGIIKSNHCQLLQRLQSRKFHIYILFQVDTAGWLERTKQDKGPSSLSIVQSRKNLMRAHVVALVLDAEEVCFV